MNLAISFTALLAIALGSVSSGAVRRPQDKGRVWEAPSGPHVAGPAQVQVKIDNPAVTVLRIRLRPRERTPMHDVTPRVVVWLTDAHLKDTFYDGRVEDLQRKAGAVEWVPRQRHAGENRSDAPVEFLAIVPKG